jgi:hypothetical protein
MKQGPFLERRSPLGVTYALLILIVFFFFLPSGFRAARLSLGQKENDVKDWLPSDFPETAELEWFADHFAGESFVLATWPGCTSGDQRLKLFEQKLLHESAGYDPSSDLPLELSETYTRAKRVGEELQLLRAADDHLNWGGKQEKWLCTPAGQWYYVTPAGRLYRWEESSNAPAAGWRAIRKLLGRYELKGTLVTAFGDRSAERIVNPFYNDTSLICASLFETVQTGDSIAATLSVPGGPLWPVDLTDASRRAAVARRLAMQRLTGTLFAPAVPPDFPWTATALRQAMPGERQTSLPADFDSLAEASLQRIADARFAGSLERLRSASQDEQTEVWYELFDAMEIEPPPRLTCVLVTLTDVAKDNLSYVVGRGVLGEPRGRLLQLAEESGVHPPSPPSLAPPPFNREPPEVVSSMPPLRMGGPPVDNMAIDEEGSVTLVRLVGYSLLLGVVLSYLCLGSFKITIMVFIVGAASAVLSMGIVWWTGGSVDAVLMSMPSLVYVLGMSGAIHIVNYYREEVRERGQCGAAGRALRHAILPCTLASVTTAIGLISLLTSNLAPISNFGLYSAIGVLLTLAILFSYLPAALQTFAPEVYGAAPERVGGELVAARRTIWLADRWANVGRWITRHHALVSATFLLLMLVAAVGLREIKTSVQLLKLFDADARIIRDYGWLESNFGKLVPMELIVRVPPDMQSESAAAEDSGPRGSSVRSLGMLERAELVSRIHTVVSRTLGEPGRGVVGQAMSTNTFLPPLPGPSNSYSPVRAKFNRELLAAGEELHHNDYLRIEKTGHYAGSELWRISLRVAALSDVDYGRFIATLREAVEPVLRAYDTRDQLLSALTVEGEESKLKSWPRVLVVGSPRPKPLDEAELLSADGEIDAHATFIATCGELLRGERIEQPEWLDVTAQRAEALTASEKWSSLVASFDAVLWLGGGGFQRDDFAAARQLIDGEAILARSVVPTLLPGRIPDNEGAGPIQVIYTGVVPVVYKAQRTLLTSLTNSIEMAFVLIAAVMMGLMIPGRFPLGWVSPGNLATGVAAGLVAMIPNVFPVLFVFGVICHMDVEIDIGTMMTASVALGIAVDDTIHFLTWFRGNLDRGMNRVDAIIETYRRVAPAMTQTTIVGGLGLSVFALSTFTPTQRFGALMLVLLVAALAGDLILLPALLAGPTGRWFKPRPALPRGRQDESPAETTGSEAAGETVAKGGQATAPLKLHLPAARPGPTRTDPAHRVKRS